MTTLFLTRKRLFIQHLDPSLSKPRHQVSYPLEADLVQSIDTYLWQWKRVYAPFVPKLPVYVVYPMQAFEKGATIRQDIKAYLQGHSAVSYQGGEHLIAAYLRGIDAVEHPLGQNIMLLEALGDFAYVYYHLGENRPPKAYFRKLPKMGWLPGFHRIRTFALEALAKQGFTADREVERSLLRQMLDEEGAGEWVIRKENPPVQIEARIALDQPTCDQLLLGPMESLQNHLKKGYIRKFNINRIFLLGNLFDREEFLTYICNSEELQTFTEGPLIQPDSKVLEAIQLGISRRVFKHIAPVLDLDTKRARLMDEIVRSCTDNQKREAYIQFFAPQASALGIPKTIVEWAITQQLSVALPQKQATSKAQEAAALDSENHIIASEAQLQSDKESEASERKDRSRSDRLKPSSSPSRAVSLKAMGGSTGTFDDQAMKKVIEADEIFSNKGFLFFKGRLKENPDDTLVFRLLKNTEEGDESQMTAFNILYEREQAYYQELSPVIHTNFGYYYYRPYIEGIPLHHALRRRKMHEKQRLRAFNSGDLKLIYKVWEAINALPHASAGLKVENLIVSTSRKWGIRKEPQVDIVGIRATPYTRAEMNADIHRIFERHLGKSLYERLKDKLRLVTINR